MFHDACLATWLALYMFRLSMLLFVGGTVKTP